MPVAASMDLRERAARAYLAGEGTYKEVAEWFAVGDASVRRWVRRFRETASLEPSPHAGGRAAKVSDAELSKLVALFEERADRTVAQVAQEWRPRMRVEISRSAGLRALHRAGLTYRRKPAARASSGATKSSPAAPPTKRSSRPSTRASEPPPVPRTA
jgi:transposase